MRFFDLVCKFIQFTYQKKQEILHYLKRVPKMILILLSLISVTVCENDVRSKDFIFLEKRSKRASFSCASIMQLKRKLLSQGFTTNEIAKLVKSIAEIVGQDWYDSGAKIDLVYGMTDNQKNITQAKFSGLNKNITINYETSLGMKAENKPIKNHLSVMRGFVTTTFEKMIFAQEDMPFALRKNILKFAKDGQLEGSRGDRFYCLYDHANFSVISIVLANDKKRNIAIMFKSRNGRKLYTPDGVAIKGDRIIFGKPINARVTSGFGYRFHPILRTPRFHYGIDYGAPTGSPVRAPADGVIAFAGRKGAFGKCVQLNHANGVSTFYAHLSSCENMRAGMRIKKGSVIGKVGSTGLSTGPHLHYEIWIHGRKINPATFVARNYEKLQGDDLAMFKSYARRILSYF